MKALLYLVAFNLSGVKPYALPRPDADEGHVILIKNIVFTIVGAMALLVIVVSGFRYIVSAGDAQKTVKARNGVIYSLVGLLIVIVADAIVSFVIHRVGR